MKKKNLDLNEEAKKFPWCAFYNWEKQKGFRILWNHPALKGIELKTHNYYLVEGIEKSLDHTTKTKLNLPDKIKIIPL